MRIKRYLYNCLSKYKERCWMFVHKQQFTCSMVHQGGLEGDLYCMWLQGGKTGRTRVKQPTITAHDDFLWKTQMVNCKLDFLSLKISKQKLAIPDLGQFLKKRCSPLFGFWHFEVAAIILDNCGSEVISPGHIRAALVHERANGSPHHSSLVSLEQPG